MIEFFLKIFQSIRLKLFMADFLLLFRKSFIYKVVYI